MFCLRRRCFAVLTSITCHRSNKALYSNRDMLKSLNCQEKAYVRFINKTNRPVDLVWVNFNGECVKYDTLQKNYFLDVNTYKTHPWMAIDCIHKDKMYIDKDFVFYPRTSKEFIAGKYFNRTIPVLPVGFETRIVVLITMPLYSLKYAAMLSIRNLLAHSDDASNLNLPIQLVDELVRTIELQKKRRRVAALRLLKFTISNLSKRFNIGKTQAADMIKHKEILLNKWVSDSNLNEKRIFLTGDGTKIDKLCYDWFIAARNGGITLTDGQYYGTNEAASYVINLQSCNSR